MKKIIGAIYICEHCGRKITNPGACGLHEKRCRKNPKNQHPCIDCEHLIVEKRLTSPMGITALTSKDVNPFSARHTMNICLPTNSGIGHGISE